MRKCRNSSAGEAGLAALFQGEVARLKNFYVFRSQFVPKSGNNTTNLGFHRNSIALATRKLPPPIPGTGAIVTYMEMGGFGFRLTISYNPNTLAQQFTIESSTAPADPERVETRPRCAARRSRRPRPLLASLSSMTRARISTSQR